MEHLHKAMQLALALHGDQTDKQGQPYLMHLLRVAGRCKTQYEMTIAILHDLVEDTPITMEYIIDQFGVQVATAIDHLTRRDKEPYGSYIDRVRLNPVACLIKVIDLVDHLREEDKALLSPDLRARYRRAYLEITGHHWDKVKHLPD